MIILLISAVKPWAYRNVPNWGPWIIRRSRVKRRSGCFMCPYAIFNKLCAWRHDMPPPLFSVHGRRSGSRGRADGNVAAVSDGQHVPTPTAMQLPDAPTRRWVKRPGDLDLWPWTWCRVTCDVGYLYANFGLPRSLCSRLRPDVRDRQTDVRQKHRLMPPSIRGGA